MALVVQVVPAVLAGQVEQVVLREFNLAVAAAVVELITLEKYI